ncbi:hypothetical protein BGW38_010997 [Lunasporangiospora selenospora]|uniref:F-box domain-containing protein n=1 Tax=Lunasporangiospora selenospora TaxID=979761 RepID=A0A9P6FXL6_9FUNG|nr:hypothetical protein BGW38_010997 [Lunasporangiospora selenospora]
MTPVHALQLPEILVSIGTFLSRRDLARCALVNSSWNTIFQPLVWNSISLSVTTPIPIPVLTQQERHIRSLCFYGRVSGEMCQFAQTHFLNQLTTLWLKKMSRGVRLTSRSEQALDLWEEIARIASHNRHSLLSIQLTAHNEVPLEAIHRVISPDRTLENGASAQNDNAEDNLYARTNSLLRVSILPPPGLTNLRHLTLSRFVLGSVQVVESVLTLCQRLESLSFLWVTIPYNRTTFGYQGEALPAGSALYQLVESQSSSTPPNPTIPQQHRNNGHQEGGGGGSQSLGRLVEYRYLRKLKLFKVLECDSRALWLWFIAPCSNLRQLEWTIAKGHGFPAYAMCDNKKLRPRSGKAMGYRPWGLQRPLEEMSIFGKDTYIEDAHLAWILERNTMVGSQDRLSTTQGPKSQQQRLATLTVPQSGFGSKTMDVLLKYDYHNVIRTLDLAGCKQVSGTMVLDILSGCPLLERFTADRVHGEEVYRDERPWVCTRLKRLVLFFDLGAPEIPKCLIDHVYGGPPLESEHEGEDGRDLPEDYEIGKRLLAIRQSIYGRLGTLHRLEVLDLKRRIHPRHVSYSPWSQGDSFEGRPMRWITCRMLALRLREGLHSLRSLTQLVHVELSDTPCFRMEEYSWKQEFWPKVQLNFCWTNLFIKHTIEKELNWYVQTKELENE